jgi:hypothetical protein
MFKNYARMEEGREGGREVKRTELNIFKTLEVRKTCHPFPHRYRFLLECPQGFDDVWELP